MANNLAGNPIIIDTADAGAVDTKSRTIVGIRWVNATTASHTAVIHNADGEVVWSCAATGAGFTHESRIKLQVTGGYKVPTLASGILYIYLE